MSQQHLSEQEIIRRDKLTALQALGIDPYPAAAFPENISSSDIKRRYLGEENKSEFSDICLAGRLMGIRDMGKASFAVLQDNAGKIQVYVKRDEICPTEDKTLYDQVWKTLDIGDIIGVKGHVFTTKTGEHMPFDADDIADVKGFPYLVIKGFVFCGANFVPLHIYLNLTSMVLQNSKTRFSHVSNAHQTTREAYIRKLGFVLFAQVTLLYIT